MMHMNDRRRVDYLLDEMLRLYDEIAALKARVAVQEEQIELLWDVANEDGNSGPQGKR
jgi:hypothetical protein